MTPYHLRPAAPLDEAAGTWSRSVTSGPVRLPLGHAVGDGWTSLTVGGPAAVVLPYLPVARLALRRLVTT
jgi:hypothetical protein